MTTCRRKELPYPDVFNCQTQTQYCPHQEESDITAGPFVVWPVGFKRDRKNPERKGTKCDKLARYNVLNQNGFDRSGKAILLMNQRRDTMMALIEVIKLSEIYFQSSNPL